MTNPIGEVVKAIQSIKGCQFASFTYRTKKTKELARYTVNLGFNYLNAVQSDILDLEILLGEIQDKTSLQYEAATLHLASLRESLTAHKEGKQHSDYTKAGQYLPIGNGLNLNLSDNSLQLFGLVVSKVQLEAGEPQKPVKSAPLTIEKNKIRRRGKVGKLREFALDNGSVAGVKVNGNTIEMVAPDSLLGVLVNQPAVAVNEPTVNVGADAAAVLVMGNR
jgi:hypothetical protein